MLISKIPIVLFLQPPVVSKYIGLINLLSELRFHYIYGLIEFAELLWHQY